MSCFQRTRTDFVTQGDPKIPNFSRTGMKFCWRTPGWSWHGYAETFMPSFGLLLLLLSLVQPGSANAACPAVVLQRLSQPQYQNTTGGNAVGSGFASVVQSFLNTVQPKPFPQGQCQQYVPLTTDVSLKSCLSHKPFPDELAKINPRQMGKASYTLH